MQNRMSVRPFVCTSVCPSDMTLSSLIAPRSTCFYIFGNIFLCIIFVVVFFSKSNYNSLRVLVDDSVHCTVTGEVAICSKLLEKTQFFLDTLCMPMKNRKKEENICIYTMLCLHPSYFPWKNVSLIWCKASRLHLIAFVLYTERLKRHFCFICFMINIEIRWTLLIIIYEINSFPLYFWHF